LQQLPYAANMDHRSNKNALTFFYPGYNMNAAAFGRVLSSATSMFAWWLFEDASSVQPAAAKTARHSAEARQRC